MITGTKKYSALRGITDRAVRKAIVKGHSLPGVLATQKLGRDYALTIDIQSLAKHLKITEKKVRDFFVVPI
jgi:hypothetical protein